MQGYKLGEHCDWFKHDNFEASTRIVTIVKPANGLLSGPWHPPHLLCI